jgi:hypothetical protein
MRKLLTYVSCTLFVFAPLFADVASAADESKDNDRLKNSGTVLKEILDVPDDIPQGSLDRQIASLSFPLS